jgi:hypothetical protein
MSIISLILVVLNFIVPRIGMLGFIVLIVNVVFIIIAGLQAKQGNAYRYPFAIRLIK